MALLTKEHARAIAAKLGAEVRSKRKAHDLAVIYEDGMRIAQFGIRRGSQKNLGHDHLPHGLHLSPRQCLDLARCPMTREQWIARLREKGLLPPAPGVGD